MGSCRHRGVGPHPGTGGAGLHGERSIRFGGVMYALDKIETRRQGRRPGLGASCERAASTSHK
jgi:hypothetical protein